MKLLWTSRLDTSWLLLLFDAFVSFAFKDFVFFAESCHFLFHFVETFLQERHVVGMDILAGGCRGSGVEWLRSLLDVGYLSGDGVLAVGTLEFDCSFVVVTGDGAVKREVSAFLAVRAFEVVAGVLQFFWGFR